MVHHRIEMGKKDDKAIRVLLIDRHKYKERVDDLIKNNTKRYVSKNSKFTISTKKTTHHTEEVCPGVKLSYNKIGFDEAVALIDTKDKDKSSQKKQNVDETELVKIYEPILQTVGELQHIRIIDLSFNFLRSISPDFATFPELHTLQLHKNLIFKLDEVLHLVGCTELRTLTLHNNPIEEVPG